MPITLSVSVLSFDSFLVYFKGNFLNMLKFDSIGWNSSYLKTKKNISIKVVIWKKRTLRCHTPARCREHLNVWFTGRIFQCALTAKIVIKWRENSNLFKLLERDTDQMTNKISPLYFTKWNVFYECSLFQVGYPYTNWILLIQINLIRSRELEKMHWRFTIPGKGRKELGGIGKKGLERMSKIEKIHTYLLQKYVVHLHFGSTHM